MTAQQLIDNLTSVLSMPTWYVMGGYGARIGSSDYINWTYEYNAEHRALIEQHITSPYTFGFDCVCLVKAVLFWGFSGDPTSPYGGSQYVRSQDITIAAFKESCPTLSTSFGENDLIPGELLFMPGHMGVYIGNGEAIECTPAWAGNVQKTLLPWRSSSNPNHLPVRTWEQHGKSSYIEYPPAPTPPTPSPTQYYIVSSDDLIDIADAIRSKTGDTADLCFPDDFISQIQSIHTPEEAVTVTLNLANGDQVVYPSTLGVAISALTITKPDTLIPGNIRNGVSVAGITGNYTGKFTITVNFTGGTFSGSQSIYFDGIATVRLTPNTGMALPPAVTVNGSTGTAGSTGVTWSYSSSSGYITLSAPTADIIITATADPA